MSHDQKVMTLLPPVEKCPSTSITELVLLPKFDNSSPSVTQDLQNWGNIFQTATFFDSIAKSRV